MEWIYYSTKHGFIRDSTSLLYELLFSMVVVDDDDDDDNDDDDDDVVVVAKYI